MANISQMTITANNGNDGEETYSRQKNKIHIAGIVFFLSVLLMTFIGGWTFFNWMKNVKYSSLSKLVLTGKLRYTTSDDIRKTIQSLYLAKTFMAQDVNAIQHQIKRLSWIKQVIVRKQWPNEIKIYLVEYVPIGHWNDQYLIDAKGNFFNIPDNQNHRQYLPRLYGPKGSHEKVLQGFYKIKQILIRNHLMLKEISMTARHSWKVMLTNGIQLNLGRDDTLKRLLRFIAIYPILHQQERISRKKISYVDLRYSSGAAVGWQTFPSKKLN